MPSPGEPTGTNQPDRDGEQVFDGGTLVTDPALESWANFSVRVETDVDLASNPGWPGYDPATHKYSRDYIQPSHYSLTLDARLGVDLQAEQPAGTGLSTRSLFLGDSGDPTSPDDLLNRLKLAPPNVTGGGGAGTIDTSELFAYRWIVEDTNSNWVWNRLILWAKTVSSQASVEVPGLRTYRVTLQVIFKDGRQAERIVQVNIREWYLVSLGDSFASGEGNPDEQGTVDRNLQQQRGCAATTIAEARNFKPKMNNPVRWLEPRAHRSFQPGPALAAFSLNQIEAYTWTPPGTQHDTLILDKVIFASHARSGARTDEGLVEPQDGDSDFLHAGQFEECARTAAGRRIDALMISIGGNDAGFSGVLTDLVARDSYYGIAMTGMSAANRAQVRARLDVLLGVGLLPGQKSPLEVLYDVVFDQVERLREAPGVGEVYISGYPTDLFFQWTGEGQTERFHACDIFSSAVDLNIDINDAILIRDRGNLLNALIQRKANEFHWHYIDVAPSFEGRGYCDPSESALWVRAEQSCLQQGDFQGTMHPNYRGHKIYGFLLQREIRRHTWPGPAPVAPRAPSKQGPVERG